METLTRSNSKIKSAELGPLGPICQAIAALVVAELRPILEGTVADGLVDRRTCRYSKRWWDRNAGRTFGVSKDGRRLVAKRADVDAAFERQAKLAPKEPVRSPRDAAEAELEEAGIKLWDQVLP